jgi:hypothetical protein
MDIGSKLAAATLGVDATALRSTLDQLRGALKRPSGHSPAPTSALAYDAKAIADSVRHVLDRLDNVDLAAVQALSGIVSEYRTENHASQLREVFARLQLGWKARVDVIIGAQMAAKVDHLLASSAPDLLRILSKEDDENAHSDLIAWLLDPRKAPIVAPHALYRLVARFEDGRWQRHLEDAIRVGSISVRREVVLAREFCAGDDLARLDITISGPGFILGIENKVWSREHDDQTQAYWNWIGPMRGLRGGLFLSPSGMAPRCPQFQAVSYLELVSCLVEGTSTHQISESEEIVLASYLKTLARAIIQVEMRAVRRLAAAEHI